MQKTQTIIITLLVLSAISLYAQSPSIILMEFEAIGISAEEASVFTEHLQVDLFNKEQFTILERSEIQKRLSKIDQPETDHSSAKWLTEAGRVSDADYVIGGSISTIGDSISVTVRMIDTRTEELIRTFIYTHSGDFITLLSEGSEEIARRLSEPILKQERQIPDSNQMVSESDEKRIEPTRKVSSPGGIGPALGSCLIGPRVGLEMNEGNDEIYLSEWIALGGQMVSGSATGVLAPLGSAIYTATRAYMAYDMGGRTNGLEGALASYFLGPRVGQEIHYRKIRNREWLQLCCIGRILIVAEAYNGKTMTEIEIEEGLRK